MLMKTIPGTRIPYTEENFMELEMMMDEVYRMRRKLAVLWDIPLCDVKPEVAIDEAINLWDGTHTVDTVEMYDYLYDRLSQDLI